MRSRLPLPAVQSVEFEIVGDPLDPAAVTAALGIEPDSAEPPGPPPPEIVEAFRPFFGDHLDGMILPGHWKLETLGHVAARWLEPHVRYLLALLEPRRDALRALAAGAELRLNVTFRPTAECKLPSYFVVQNSQSLWAAAAFERLGITLFSLSITGFPKPLSDYPELDDPDDEPWRS
jgi:hypothetical protein